MKRTYAKYRKRKKAILRRFTDSGEKQLKPVCLKTMFIRAFPEADYSEHLRGQGYGE